MEIRNEFTLSRPPEESYVLLLDLERVAGCVPGTTLGQERAGGGRELSVAIKLGPMRLAYDGTVAIASRDDVGLRAVMEGTARERRGAGSASARITMSVVAEGEGSRVLTLADIDLTGRAAQMGKGIVEDVARRMMAEMAVCLETRVAAEVVSAPSQAPGAPIPAPPAATAPPIRALALLRSIIIDRFKALVRRRA